MSGVLIVAFLVNCSQSLLLCEEINLAPLAYRDMTECRSHLSRIVQNQQHRFGAGRAIMGKCHYLLVESDQDSRLAALPKGRHIQRPAGTQVLQSAPELYQGAARATGRPEMVRNPAN